MRQPGGNELAETSLDVALKWAQLPPEQLEIALKALEPQLTREHEIRLKEIEVAAQNGKEKRAQTLFLTGLIVAFLLCSGMLTSAVIVGVNDQPWLAAMLSGPSLLSLASLFVLRKNDRTLSMLSGRAHGAALSASSPPPSPPVV